MAAFPFAVATTHTTNRAHGRALFWLGIGVSLLGIVAVVTQYNLKNLMVPWYLPALGTLGALLLLGAVARRPSIVRIVVLGLLAALAGFEWYFLVSASRLPAYEGPAQAGQTFPAFATTLADGRPFTEKDLQGGTPTVLVFFRGRW
jgi:hypothetical protein